MCVPRHDQRLRHHYSAIQPLNTKYGLVAVTTGDDFSHGVWQDGGFPSSCPIAVIIRGHLSDAGAKTTMLVLAPDLVLQKVAAKSNIVWIFEALGKVDIVDPSPGV